VQADAAKVVIFAKLGIGQAAAFTDDHQVRLAFAHFLQDPLADRRLEGICGSHFDDIECLIRTDCVGVLLLPLQDLEIRVRGIACTRRAFVDPLPQDALRRMAAK
jgi:hypothetical protein